MDRGEILQAIRRIASENGGRAPGKVQFEQVTGVKEWHWSGKYWTKWRDAVREAGFEPNDLQGSFSEEHLLEQLALFTDELGRMSTSAELRLRRRSVPDFPSHNTFARFGDKKRLTGTLLKFCSEHDKFKHLVPMLEALPHSLPADEVHLDYGKDDVAGYVYLMQFGNEYKIGTSSNVERRFRELKTQMPYEGTIIHTISTGDPEGIEAYWHRYFGSKRLNGEWFKLGPDDVKYFRKRKLM